MNHVKVESSHISSVGYDEKTRVLEVKFTNGDTYRYADVTPEKHRRLMDSASVGKYFRKAINGIHPSSKVM